MNEASVGYWETLSSRFGAAWNRFWFTPASVVPVAGLRWLVGLASLYFVASHTADLTVWFGTRGLLPVDTVTRLTGEVTESGAASSNLHWSYLNYFTRPVELWVAHTIALGVVALFTVGLWSRVTGILSLVVVLSYIHRAPMLTGQFEPVLSMLLAYLCLAPTGAWASVDRWLRSRKAGGDSAAEPPRTVMSNISLRLIQVHIAGLYLIMALSKLSGTFGAEYDATWWRGEALWWLITRSESRLIDLTMLSGTTGGYFVNAWSHLIVAYELAFAILIWKPLARPLLLLIGVVTWLSLAMVTGLVSFCLIMLVANLAFLPESTWRGIGRRVSG